MEDGERTHKQQVSLSNYVSGLLENSRMDNSREKFPDESKNNLFESTAFMNQKLMNN